MIEPAAARLAATRRSAEQLQALASALADMTAAVDDPLAYYRADLAFHRAVFAASGNPFVDRLGAIVSAVLEVSFRLQRRSLIPMAVGLAMHERVLDAVRAPRRRCGRARHGRDHRGGAHRARARHRSSGMKITKLETIRLLEFPNILWVRVHGEDGLYGLGETFMAAASVEAYLHEIVAPAHPRRRRARDRPDRGQALRLSRLPLVGRRDARRLGGRHRALGPVGQGHRPADRASCWAAAPASASAPTTPAPATSTSATPRLQQVENWGLGNNAGPYEDLEGFLHRADELALSLLEQGITGMKIWPFDPAAEASGGHYISGPDLDRALEPFRKIREAVGDKMDIMVEFHSLWNLPTAIRIARALEPFDTFWHEDPIKMDALADLAAYAARQPRAGLRLGDAGLPPVLPRAAGSARRRHRHARPVLVRRPVRGQEDRHHGRGLASAGGAARLHRPGGARRLDATSPATRPTR